MIRILDLCDQSHPMCRDEFVLPVARIVHRYGRKPILQHPTHIPSAEEAPSSGIILCGTALQDMAFLLHLESLRWVRDTPVPVLGICAGMQVMVSLFGGTLAHCEEIGMTNIHTLVPDPLLEGRQEFSAYELHAYAPVPTEVFQVLAVSSAGPQVIRHRILPQYGVLFHPEVRNEWVIERFLDLCGEGMV